MLCKIKHHHPYGCTHIHTSTFHAKILAQCYARELNQKHRNENKKEFYRISCTDAINTAKIAVIRITFVRNTLEYIRNGKKENKIQ